VKDLANSRLYAAEEMSQKLMVYEEFVEGGTRIQLEIGKPTTLAEITVDVMLYGKLDDCRQFYFNADIPLKDAKKDICANFSSEAAEITPDKYTLHRVDAFNDPTYALNK